MHVFSILFWNWQTAGRTYHFLGPESIASILRILPRRKSLYFEANQILRDQLLLSAMKITLCVLRILLKPQLFNNLKLRFLSQILFIGVL